MKRLSRFAGMVAVVSLLFGGCGTPMYELTPEEETIIARYSAYALAKHNVFQKDGIMVVDSSLLEETKEPEESEGPGDTEEPEEPKVPDSPFGGSSGEVSGEAPQGSEVEIAEALGLGGKASISYGGYMVDNHYQEGKYFAMDAKDGRTYVILKFNIKNISSETIAVDNMGQQTGFRASFDGKDWVREETTLLLTSLSNYVGQLAAGEEKELVLLFQISEEKSQNITGVSLAIEVNGSEKPVKL